MKQNERCVFRSQCKLACRRDLKAQRQLGLPKHRSAAFYLIRSFPLFSPFGLPCGSLPHTCPGAWLCPSVLFVVGVCSYWNGLTIVIPSPSKSFVFLVASVRPNSKAVAAIRESMTGRVRREDNSPQRSEISAVIAMVQFA